MAETVVKSVEIRETGAQRVYDRLDQLVRVAERTVSAFTDVGQSTEQTARKVGSSAREFDRYTERMAGTQRVMRDYARDLRAIGAGLNTGAFGEGAKAVAGYNAELQKIRQTLQDVGRPTGGNSGLQTLISDLRGVGSAAKSAEDSAAAMSAAFAAIDTGRTSLQQTINELNGIGQGALSARESMSAFGALFKQEADDAARAAEKLASEVEQLRLTYDPAYAAAQRMGAELENLARLEREGITILGGYDAALDRIVLKYDEAAQAARKASEAQKLMIADARAAQMAASSQIEFNRQLGVPTNDNGARVTPRSARDSAAVFEADIKQGEAQAKRLQEIRAEIDPLRVAQDKYNDTVAEYAALNASRNLSDADFVKGLEVAKRRLDDTEKSLKQTGGLGAQELTNLQYQLNDIGVSLASGQSPFTVMLQQGAQIGQLFGPDAKVNTALKSVGEGIKSFLTNPINLAVLGIAALAGAAALLVNAFGNRTEKAMAAAAKATDSYSEALTRAKENSDKLADSVENAQGKALKTTERQTQASINAALTAAREARVAAEKAIPDAIFTAQGGYNPIANIQDSVRRTTLNPDSSKALEDLGNRLKTAQITAKNARAELDLFQSRGGLPTYLKEGAAALGALIDKMIQAEADTASLTDAFARLRREQAQLRFDKAIEGFSGFLPEVLNDAQKIEKAFEDAAGSAQSMGQVREAYRKRGQALGELGRPMEESALAAQQAVNNFDLSPLNKQIAETTQEYAARIKEYERTTGDAAGLANLQYEQEQKLALIIKENTRAEEARRANYQLDLKAITDVTVAQQAATAGQRAYVEAIAAGQDEGYAQARSAEASVLRYRQAEKDSADAVREAQAARDQAGLEGYAAQVAAVNAQYAEQMRLADGSAVALEALAQARELELDALGINTRKQLLGAQEDELRLLQAEAGLIGANDNVRRSALATIQAEIDLKRQGVDANSDLGQSYLANAARISTLDISIDKQTEAFETARDAAHEFFDALSSGKGILDSLIGAFAGFGKKLASDGFDKIFGSLFGGSAPAAPPSGGGVMSSIGSAVSNFSGGSGATSYGNSQASLPPLVTGEGFSASKAATVAGQSVPARVWNFFAGKGLAPHQIAGIMGNVKGESNFNPSAVGDNGNAFGLFQWNDRGPAMQRFVGSDWRSDVDGQLEFAWKELQTSESRAYRALLNAKDVTQSTEAFLGFERPSGYNTGVRNSHGYSGRVTGANEAYRQFGGSDQQPYRVTSSIDERRATTKAVSDGVVDANRQLANSNDPWSGTRTAGGFDGFAHDSSIPERNTGSQGLFGPRGIAGLQVAGAGFGAFSNGYQSGSPFGGGFSGAFSGYGAGESIATLTGMPLGAASVLGGVGGAALGILGGILGGRAQRKAQHKAAAAEWDKVRPAYEEFDRSLSGEGTGELRSMITGLWGQLEGFMEKGGAAWKYGKGNSSAQFAATGTKMFTRWAEEIHEFQDGFQYMLDDLSSGQGLQGAFANGRAQVKKLDEEVKNFIDDVQIAFGSNDIGIPTSAEFDAMSERTKADREKRVADAKRAAGEYALTMLYTAETQTEVEKALDSFKGTAAGLMPILTKLGWTAEEAAKAIDERLTAAIAEMRSTFEKDVADRISSLKGEGYLSDVRDFLEEFDTLKADATRLGADQSNFGELFKLELQSIVDGAELTGTAFDALIKAFPQLSGVVTAFVETTETVAATTKEIQSAYEGFLDQRLSELTAERAEAENALRSEYERTVNYLDGIKNYLNDMRLDENLSTLDAKGRFDEAQKLYRETLFKANGGDSAAQDALLGSAQDYLDIAKSYYVSSEEYGDVYAEIESTLKGTAAKTETALDVARRQASFLGEIADATKGLPGLMKEYLDAVQKVNDTQKLVDNGRTFGINTERNRLIDAGLKQVGLNYTGNYGIVNGADPFLEWRSALVAEQRSVVEGIIMQYIGINRQAGGLIPGYANGGIVGNGLWNRDSVLARYAGGGSIGLAGGEMVISAPRVTPQTYPVLAEINRTGRAPGGDNRGVEDRLDRVEALLRLNVQTVGQGLRDNTAAVENGNRSGEQVALAARRNAARAA